MGLRYKWKCIQALIALPCITTLPDPLPYNNDDKNIWEVQDMITCDICIIGSGASGTYSAIRLRDMNQSVVIIEQTDRLGGHTETFTDPVTQATIDIGVLIWHNTDLMKNFFTRFGVALTEECATGGI